MTPEQAAELIAVLHKIAIGVGAIATVLWWRVLLALFKD